jgi:hypothetical protein
MPLMFRGIQPVVPEPADGVLRGFWRLHTADPLRILISLVSLLAFARSCRFAIRNLEVPAWLDFWFWVANFQLWVEHRFTLHDLIKPQNEHRIVTTQLLLLLDSVAFDMTGRSVVIFNLAVLCVLGLMLSRLVRLESKGWDWPPLFWVALISAICQYENMVLPIGVMVAITCAAACAAALLLVEATLDGGAVCAAGAGLLAITADFSMASGVLVTPALFALLAFRRARLVVWSVFTPLALMGVVLFFYHYSPGNYPDLHLFDWRFVVIRIVYIGNLLGSAFKAFPRLAAGLGLFTLFLFLLAALGLLRRYVLKGKPIPAGDAALVTLGLFIAVCGPAGAVTPRILFGAQAGLVSRYATESLLFIAAVLGLYIRWAAQAPLPAWVSRFALPGIGLLILGVTNVPDYDRMGNAWYRTLTDNAQPLVNNVAVEGPAMGLFPDKPKELRESIAFLHARKLNMFSPQAGPPPSLLAGLRGVDIDKLPACRGFIDHAYAIDSTGFMLRGWLTDSDSRRSAQWIAVLDAKGVVLGTMRPMTGRTDVQIALGTTEVPNGFDGGFRLTEAGEPGESRMIRVFGLFPGQRQPVCSLPPSHVGPVLIEPAIELLDTAPASAIAETNELQVWQNDMERPIAAIPGGVQAWGIVPEDGAVKKAVMRFRLDSVPSAGRALAIPFAMAKESSSRHIVFIMGDGVRFETALPSIWDRPEWRAVVIPSELLIQHGGPVTVEIFADGDTWFAVGAPLTATLQPEWSRLF